MLYDSADTSCQWLCRKLNDPAVGIGGLDLDDQPVPRGIMPDAVKAHGVSRPLVATIRDVILQPSPQFVDEVLQHLPAFGEGIAEAIVRVGCQRVDGHLPQI